MSVGGPTANRFDVPRTGAGTTANYLKQLGNLALDFATDEIAFFAQDSWKLKPNFTLNYGIRWEGAFNPTPEANNEFMLNAAERLHASRAAARSIRRRFPIRLNQWGPRVGLRVGRNWRRPHGRSRLQRPLLRANAGAHLGLAR